MPDLLLELFSEEIPARMQVRAAEDLQRLVGDGLKAAGLSFSTSTAESGPRRLSLQIEGLSARSADIREEKKGPRVGAPEKAIEGFLRSAGLQSLDDCETRDDGKGAYYVAILEKPGRAAGEIVAEIVPDVIRKFPWPKSMRWGSSRLRWVRPLHSILCILDGKTVPFEIEGLTSSATTYGHRRALDPALRGVPLPVKNAADYRRSLAAANVVVERSARVETILEQAQKLAANEKLDWVEDHGLVDENAGLAEWPVVLAGSFDESFLDVPQEVLITSMKAHQKCFSLRYRDSTRLANRFLMVANLQAADCGKSIIAGNERVIRARLSDARFFWRNDKARGLEAMLPKLDEITFHEKLGTQGERVRRIMKLARELAPLVGADTDKAERAARLCKADLVSEMVGEFPELQGIMGRYIALEHGEAPEVADAIAEHYKPAGQDDSVPTAPVSIAAALVDKLDMLIGFWTIDEQPTGSKDPYALRRAALGVIRIILDNKLRIALTEIVQISLLSYVIWGFRPKTSYPDLGYRELVGERTDDKGVVTGGDWSRAPYYHLLNYDGFFDGAGNLAASAEIGCPDIIDEEQEKRAYEALSELKSRIEKLEEIISTIDFSEDELEAKGLVEFYANRVYPRELIVGAAARISKSISRFLADRLKVHLREQGARHDLIDAVFALPGQDDLLMIVRRVEALGRFLETDDGANLLAGVKRAQNILKIEEKKDKRSFDGEVEAKLLTEPQEKALAKAIDQARKEARKSLEKEDFEGAMAAMAKLRAPVDAFFDKVMVNDADAARRENRLKLLSQIRAATLDIADFSKIEG